MKMPSRSAIPPRRGIGRRWMRRLSPGSSTAPRIRANRPTAGVRTSTTPSAITKPQRTSGVSRSVCHMPRAYFVPYKRSPAGGAACGADIQGARAPLARPSAVANRVRVSPTASARCLLRAIKAVTRIPQARDDVAAVVELAVDRGGVDHDVRMLSMEALDSLRRRDEADQVDRAGPRVLDRCDRCGGGVPR